MIIKAPKTAKYSKPIAKMNTLMKAIGLIGLTVTSQANAFVVEKDNQKTILIGNGSNLNPVQVNVVPTPPASTTVQITQSYPQQTTAVETPVYSEQNPYTTYEQYQNQQAYQQYHQPYQTTPQYQQTTPQYQQYQSPTYSGTFNYGNTGERLSVGTNSSSVLVFDLQTGQPLYQKNVDATRSIASITKMMTAMVLMDSGLNLEEEIVITSSDLVGAKSASTRLKAGDRLTRKQFMLMMLMKSENPAAKVLATTYPGGFDAFISAMNQKAQSLGMHQTRFGDSSGLNPRNVSSANDLGKMMREIATNPRYQTIRNFSTAKSFDFYIQNYYSGNRTYSASNTSRAVRSGPYSENITASKTGFIREAGYCVVMETNFNGRPAVVVQLGAGSSNSRWNDADRILGQLALR